MTAPAPDLGRLRPPAAAAGLAALSEMLGTRFSAGLAVREQHCNTTTWLAGPLLRRHHTCSPTFSRWIDAAPFASLRDP
jgi:hypothetical protein